MRTKTSVPSRRRRKKIIKKAKGFFGCRKGNIRQVKDAVMKAEAFSTRHRRRNKNRMRCLWIVRIGVASKINGLSYSRLINGLSKAQCRLNRKVLANLALRDPEGFSVVAQTAKKALAPT